MIGYLKIFHIVFLIISGQKVINKFGGVKKLPNSLEIDYDNTIKKDYTNNMMSDIVSTNV